MEVATCTLRPRHLRRRPAAFPGAGRGRRGRKCTPSATSYCVGAVVAPADGAGSFTGHTHETSPTHHAEQEAIRKALDAGAELRGAAIYSSMEPCSQRKSETGELHAAPPAPRIRTRGLCAVRTRPVRLLPRGADAARSGRRRTGLSLNWPKACTGPTPTSEGETGVIYVHKGLKLAFFRARATYRDKIYLFVE